MLTIEDHPLLSHRSFVTEFSTSLGELSSPQELLELMKLDAAAPLQSSDEIRLTVRDLLRHGGFKPTGRSKPASEYLIKAATQGVLSTINVAVDACNVVSLHSGIPISVVDLDLVSQPLRVAIAEKGDSYVFNQSGQEIDIGGLLCLFDAEGPCANAVKDSQRTKTSEKTCRTLTLIWGPNNLVERVDQAEKWYRELLESAGGECHDR